MHLALLLQPQLAVRLDYVLCAYYTLFGKIFKAFYPVDCEEQASSAAHFSFMYLCFLPDNGRMKDSHTAERDIIKECKCSGVVCVDWFYIDYLAQRDNVAQIPNPGTAGC
jgi:hypothetical protein